MRSHCHPKAYQGYSHSICSPDLSSCRTDPICLYLAAECLDSRLQLVYVVMRVCQAVMQDSGVIVKTNSLNPTACSYCLL